MISRKDKIYDYVKLHTKEMIDTHSLENSGSDALSIALDLKLDRTNVSRELNTLWKEGRLIKLQGRPTLYLDCEALKTEYPNHYIPLTVSAGSSLLDFIQKPQKTQKRELPFHKTALDAIIGSAGSLKNETAQVLALSPIRQVASRFSWSAAPAWASENSQNPCSSIPRRPASSTRTPGSSSSTARITPTPRSG